MHFGSVAVYAANGILPFCRKFVKNNPEVCMEQPGDMHGKNRKYVRNSPEICMERAGSMYGTVRRYAWNDPEVCIMEQPGVCMETREHILLLLENISRVLVGREDTTRRSVIALLAGGHVLLEDLPGTGKTTLAKALAKSVGGRFMRIQFTPDLLPSDVTGLSIWNKESGKFEFRRGPVFTNILLADEINRATPRTQSGLLECMEERQVTVDGETRKLEEPFFVIATQNPVETSGTFPLPEAQLDRFLMRLSLGLPDREEEMRILRRFMAAEPLEEIREVCRPEDLIAARRISETIHISDELLSYIADIVIATRKRGDIAAGVSSRGTLALMRAARASAFLDGRDYVVPEDIKYLAEPVLAHRLILFRNYRQTMTQETILREIIESVPVPTEDFRK